MRLLFVVILIAAVACASPGSVANHSTRPVTQAQLYAWTYEGVVRQNSIDNRVVALPDGGYRQVFSRFRSFALNSEGLPGKEAYAVTATSKDGLHWTDEGESPIGYYVPVRLADGSYRAYAGGELYMSTDAKNWTLVGHVVLPEATPLCHATSGGFSDILALPDGTLRGYYNCEVGRYFNIPTTAVHSATSKDGLVWQKDPGERINPLEGHEIPHDSDGKVSGPGAAEHPRIVRLPDGTLKMFYHSLNMCCLWSATSVDGLTWTNRKPENVFGGDADVIVLADGRLRVFVNGNLGLPSEFAGHSAGENRSRTVSYIYGPTNYRLELPNLLAVVPGSVAPTHLSVVIRGSGTSVKFDAFAYAGTGGTSTYNLIDGSYEPTRVDYHGSYDPVKVVFNPPFGKPPLTADAVFNWTVSPLDQAYVLSFGTLVVAYDGTTRQVVPVRYGWSNSGPSCGPGTGTPCGADCGPGTGTPCPPTNCGPGTGTPCSGAGQNCGLATGTPCPGAGQNCGPGTGTPCAAPSAPPCQLGQPVGPQGCIVPGQFNADNGTPIYCPPPSQAGSNPPPACKQYY